MSRFSGRLGFVYRHPLLVRTAHWLNVPCLLILVLSGLQIFNAHPALYWGERSDRGGAWLAIDAADARDGSRIGITTIFGVSVTTTGILGLSTDSYGVSRERAFPSWATLPAGRWLAMGRRWHLFFAWVFVVNGVVFAVYSLGGPHFWRDLVPRWADLRGLGRSALDHLRLRHPEDSTRYNPLQRLAYTFVVFVLGPVVVWTGLAMSPMMDASFPWMVSLVGGRQSARSIHFVACFALIGYTIVHVAMVVITGFKNNLRSMVSGWYRISTPRKEP